MKTTTGVVGLLVLLLAVGSRAVVPQLTAAATDGLVDAFETLFGHFSSWYTSGSGDVKLQFPPGELNRRNILVAADETRNEYMDSTVSEATYSFSQKFLMEYRKMHPDSSLVYSPVSLSAALSTLYFGAKGETKELMESVLGFQNGVAAALKSKDNKELESSKVVSVANRAYFADSITLEDAYVRSVGKKNVALLPFASDPITSKDIINQFVNDATRGLINEIVSDSQITSLTEMVLVNAIYFKGSWKYSFPRDKTVPLEFRGVSASPTVDFMKFGKGVSLLAGNVPELDSQVLELPYSHPKFSMYILLPNTDGGWRDAEKKLMNLSPTFFLDSVFPQPVVYVTMPKWTLDSSISEVTEILDRMGLGPLFTNPDFSGIADAGLGLTDVVHKAKITVDEEGTEAAAATAVIASRSVPLVDDTVRFVLDHPFLYFILDKTDNTILFQGTVTDL